MKKNLLALALVLMLGGVAQAQTRSGQPVFSVIKDTNTCKGNISISSTAATNVIDAFNAVSTQDYSGVYIENESVAGVNIYCSESATVTTNDSGGPQGKELPGTTAHTQHAAMTAGLLIMQKYYCRADAASAKATVCKWR